MQSEPEIDYDSPKKQKRKTSAPPVIGGPGSSCARGLHKFKSVPDEPYPAHSHLDAIYDVPARIRRKVGMQMPHRRIEVPRTVGRVEGMKEVRTDGVGLEGMGKVTLLWGIVLYFNMDYILIFPINYI